MWQTTPIVTHVSPITRWFSDHINVVKTDSLVFCLLLSFCCVYCSVLCMIKPGLYTCFSDFLWFIAAHQVVDYLNTTKESLLMKMAWEMMNPEYKKVFLLSSCLWSSWFLLIVMLTFLLMILTFSIDYQGMQRKPTAVKKKDHISKTAAPPSKKTSATTSLSNAESEKKKVSATLPPARFLL